MFNLTTKGHHATRIMVCLARSGREGPKRIHEIAEEEGVTKAFAGQILSKLKVARLVRSHRGASGGFVLARDPEEITVFDVLTATEGPILVRPCLNTRCPRAAWCMSRTLWHKANEALTNVFSSTTIAEMVSGEESLRLPNEMQFDI